MCRGEVVLIPLFNEVASIIVVYNYEAAESRYFLCFYLYFIKTIIVINNNKGWVLIFRVRINKMVFLVSILIQLQ